MTDNSFAAKMEHFIFGHRRLLIGVFVLVSLAMALIVARGLRIDASFTKQLPLQHEYMQTFVKHQAEFGGANRVLVAPVSYTHLDVYKRQTPDPADQPPPPRCL